MNHRHIIIVFLLAAIGAFSATFACNDLENEDTVSADLRAGVRVLSMGRDHLDVSLSQSEPSFETIATEAGEFASVSLGDHALRGEIGAPAIPTYGLMFAIPQGARVDIEYEEGKIEWFDDVALAPMQSPAPDSYDVPQPEFAFDETAYEVDMLAPASPVYMEEEKIMRGVRVANLWITPIRYNAAKRRMGLITDLKVSIHFSGGEGRFFSRPQLRTKAFDNLFGGLIANHPVFENPIETKSLKAENPARFLIITHPDFAEFAKQLQTWKRQMGISTLIATTDVIGEKNEDIQAYIQQAYDSDSPPEYVLLFGDAEFVPTNYRTLHVAHFTLTGTDLYYACVDGMDYYPDISIGRISVDTLQQAQQRIERIIQYQKAPPAKESFFTTTWQFGFFQDDNRDGNADRRFAQTSEEIYRWFNEILEDGVIESRRCYSADAQADPAAWNQSASYHYFPSWWMHSVKGIPPELTRTYGFDWTCGEEDIAAAVNEGTFFITHRDHGSTDGWAAPSFNSINVLEMLNNDKHLPVVFSVNCQTGWFDNESDSFFNLTPEFYLCFSEAWERARNGGAVGVIAPTRISYSGFNDRLVWGWMDALWPDYIPEYSGEHPWTSHGFIPAMGDVLNYGKMYLTTVYWPEITRKIEIEMFHWFGDPTMKMWIGPPEELRVNHDEICRADAQTFEAQVFEDGATITLVYNGELLSTAVADRGGAILNIASTFTETSVATLTVTKEGYRPYVADILFVECESDADCSDDLFCNGVEACVNDLCQPGAAPECGDGVFCNGTEICDEDADACVSMGDSCPGQNCDEQSEQCFGGAPDFEFDGDDDDDDASACGMF
jgi:Peptidase family C25/Propeptide_C25/Peptidase family C25, C terminal ig-like domain